MSVYDPHNYKKNFAEGTKCQSMICPKKKKRFFYNPDATIHNVFFQIFLFDPRMPRFI